MLQGVLERVYDWLSPSNPVAPGDVIFVLGGRKSRKLYALRLYSEGVAPTLIISVGRFEIRRFSLVPGIEAVDLMSLAAPIPPPQRHFFVVLESGHTTVTAVRRGRFGTLSEIRGLAAWLRAHPGVKSVLIVSSGFHLRRIRACCRVLLPAWDVRYLSVPDDGSLTATGWWRSPLRRVVLWEIPKLLAYRLALSRKQMG